VLQELGNSLAALAAVPAALTAEVRLAEAAEMLLRPLATASVPPPAEPNAVELLGWLELALDDAPALIVTTFNEGFVPKSALADAFLPNNLRRELGLLHNDRRYARDAYALSVLLSSREQLQLVVGHRDPEGNPLIPSRLLFATEAKQVAERALKFFQAIPPAPPRRNLLAGDALPRERTAIAIPQPVMLQADGSERVIAHLSVSQFKAYLACPYRFYLGHVLKLSARADSAAELDGGGFGDLMHDCLQHFGRDEVRHQTDPDKIQAFLSDRLTALAAARFGARSSRAAIRVQVEQVRTRFNAFAQWQAERTRQGWQIAYSEDFEQQLSATISVDGAPFEIRGRIDRIDYHPQQQQLCVLDYKTSDTGKRPDKAHRQKGEWVDLQLPLYRHLLHSLQLAAQYPTAAAPQLGYINLPKDLAAIGALIADWNDGDLQAADEAAHAVVRGVRQGQFWPKNGPPEYPDDFTAICQDHVLAPWSAEDQRAQEAAR
jgi:RecB family exonuclease